MAFPSSQDLVLCAVFGQGACPGRGIKGNEGRQHPGRFGRKTVDQAEFVQGQDVAVVGAVVQQGKNLETGEESTGQEPGLRGCVDSDGGGTEALEALQLFFIQFFPGSGSAQCEKGLVLASEGHSMEDEGQTQASV